MPQDSPVPQYPSHRPRYKGHDYYERGIYLITIVIAHRDPLFGSLNMDPVHPGVDLTPLGRAVEEEWVATPSIQAEHGRSVKNLGHIVMPDHFHGVLFVEERMDISVGRIIRGFKVACTQRWRLLQGQPSLVDTPTEGNNGAPNQGNNGAPNQGNNEAPNQGNNEAPNQGNNGAPNGAPEGPLTPDGRPLSAMSHAQRARYYASLPRNQQPLFDDNYDDSVLYAPNQLEAMLAYVHDNPRRAILKARVPQFMQSCLCLTIAGVRYSAFGNFLLLRRPLKAQVFCHRMARMGQLTLDERLANGYTALPYPPDMRSKVRYIDTQAWQRDREAWIKAAQNDTVLVTPGISPGERDMKNIAINCRLPLIHLQKEPITKKPEGERFFACAEGSLLILAPWAEDLDAMPRQFGGDYDRFHNMNLLAEQICAMDVAHTELSFRVIE